jgi:hypothetical protein
MQRVTPDIVRLCHRGIVSSEGLLRRKFAQENEDGRDDSGQLVGNSSPTMREE